MEKDVIIFSEGRTSIERNVLSDIRGLRKVHIPSSVQTIDTSAFSGIKTLEEITVDENNANYVSVDGILYSKDMKKLINVPPAKELVSFVIPESVEEIESYAFEDCVSLEHCIISSNVKRIGGYSFYRCAGLKEIEIPNNLEFLEDSTFTDCNRLTKVELPEGLKIIGKFVFSNCRSLSIINIPESVVQIGSGAFMKCDSIETIKLPEAIEMLEGGIFGVFQECNSLQDITIPARGELFTEGLFRGCRSLKNITLPEDMTEIKDGTFEDCKSIEQIELPHNIKKIGRNAFCGCAALKSIVIPENVEVIGERAFSYSGLEQIYIPDNVKAIGYGAFEYSKNLKNVRLSGNVEKIDYQTFHECSLLEEISNFNNVREIGRFAFGNCSSMTGIELSESTVKLGEAPFAGCNNLKFIIAPGLTPSNFDTFTKPQALMGFLKNKEKYSDSMAQEYYNYFVRYYKNTLPLIVENDIAEIIDLWIEKNKITDANYDEVYSFVCLKNAERCKVALEKWANKSNDQEAASDTNKDKRAIEIKAEEYCKSHDLHEEATKGVIGSVHYADNPKEKCSQLVLITILNEYIDEFYKVSKLVSGEISTRRDIDSNKKLFKSEIADSIAAELNKDELTGILKKLVGKASYRPYIIAYARYATDDQIKEYIADIKAHKRGNLKSKYKAENMMRALYISDMPSAFEFIEKQGDLTRYAEMRGKTVDECRLARDMLKNTAMVPDLGMNENNVHTIKAGNKTFDAFIGSNLKLVLKDDTGKVIKSIPKKDIKESDQKKAQKEFADLKKTVDGFVKDRKEELLKYYLRDKAMNGELWAKSYMKDPVLREISKTVIWCDEDNNKFILTEKGLLNADDKIYEPRGDIKPAHVLNMTANEIDNWQKYLNAHQTSLLIPQVWESIAAYTDRSLRTRYEGLKLTNKERNAVKSELKSRGIEVRSGDNRGEYDYRNGTYIYSDTNDMFFGTGMSITYQIDQDTKDITFGGNLKAKKGTSKYEINTILSVLDKYALKLLIEHDNAESINNGILDQFTPAQLLEFIDYAAEKGSVNCSSMLQEYKHNKYPEYDAFYEFVID